MLHSIMHIPCKNIVHNICTSAYLAHIYVHRPVYILYTFLATGMKKSANPVKHRVCSGWFLLLGFFLTIYNSHAHIELRKRPKGQALFWEIRVVHLPAATVIPVQLAEFGHQYLGHPSPEKCSIIQLFQI